MARHGKASAGARGVLRFLRESLEVLALTAAAALALKLFIVDAVRVPSASMEETIRTGDFLLVNKFVYGPRTPRYVPLWKGEIPSLHVAGPAVPRRGDVIVFYAPDAGRGRLYVKRVAGLPGDTLEIRGGALIVGGRRMAPPPTARLQEGDPPDFGPVRVPEDSCFVLGDNLEESLDSRAWGFVPMESIVGRAMMVYWSIAPGGGIRWHRLFTMIR